MLLWNYKEDIKWISSWRANHNNYFGDFWRHLFPSLPSVATDGRKTFQSRKIVFNNKTRPFLWNSTDAGHGLKQTKVEISLWKFIATGHLGGLRSCAAVRPEFSKGREHSVLTVCSSSDISTRWKPNKHRIPPRILWEFRTVEDDHKSRASKIFRIDWHY